MLVCQSGKYTRNEVSTSKKVSMFVANKLTYATTFIHLIHIAYLPNNIALFCNDKNNFLNGSGKIEYCRGFGLNGSFDISCYYSNS